MPPQVTQGRSGPTPWSVWPRSQALPLLGPLLQLDPQRLSPDMTEDLALHVPWGRTHGAVSSQGQGIKDRDTVAPHSLQILQR